MHICQELAGTGRIRRQGTNGRIRPLHPCPLGPLEVIAEVSTAFRERARARARCPNFPCLNPILPKFGYGNKVYDRDRATGSGAFTKNGVQLSIGAIIW